MCNHGRHQPPTHADHQGKIIQAIRHLNGIISSTKQPHAPWKVKTIKRNQQKPLVFTQKEQKPAEGSIMDYITRAIPLLAAYQKQPDWSNGDGSDFSYHIMDIVYDLCKDPYSVDIEKFPEFFSRLEAHIGDSSNAVWAIEKLGLVMPKGGLRLTKKEDDFLQASGDLMECMSRGSWRSWCSPRHIFTLALFRTGDADDKEIRRRIQAFEELDFDAEVDR
ncbi:hypothetical protein BJ508DRAFT_374307 [Ascobolus immersus RN42]|uniref:Uncharacterized protein n=1 Tax=Ascobolus immersus RN42 TaxID=1160509 RepID=A0A3N4IFV0_ASCIM|nr:hypothetical protein BJ508DRAFT_374307 [Ascobolus immersus RN42]